MLRKLYIFATLFLVLALSAAAYADFTFSVMSDLHFGFQDLKADPPITAETSKGRIQTRVDLLKAFVGAKPPKGIFVLGDLTDGNNDAAIAENQWDQFGQMLPALGLKWNKQVVPVFALAGNHDGALDGPQRKGLLARNQQLLKNRKATELSANGVHFAVRWENVHILGLGLCPADTTDAETPFIYGKPGAGSWNDPQGAFTFLKSYLERKVGKSGNPVILMHHYGFDGFSTNDWNWWTVKQRKELYNLLADYNVVAIFHGHDHALNSYQWPDPKRHAPDIAAIFPSQPPASYRQYPILSCGEIGWLVHVQKDSMTATRVVNRDGKAEAGEPVQIPLKPRR